jgi:hypothetical protein
VGGDRRLHAHDLAGGQVAGRAESDVAPRLQAEAGRGRQVVPLHVLEHDLREDEPDVFSLRAQVPDNPALGIDAPRPPHRPGAARVDPRVKSDVGALARTGLSLTLRDPIALSITGYDDTGWTKPNGSPVDDYWNIVHGAAGRILRLEYSVPPSAGFVVGDIRIGGRPIEWGGHIAEHVTCTVGGVAGTRARG